MDGDPQVKSLVAASTAVAVREAGAKAVEYLLPVAQRLALDQLSGVNQSAADFLAARDFSHTGAARAVGQYQEVAGEKGAVSAAQVEQHTVVSGHRNDLQSGDVRGGRCRQK